MQPNKSKATLQLVIATLLSLFGIDYHYRR